MPKFKIKGQEEDIIEVGLVNVDGTIRMRLSNGVDMDRVDVVGLRPDGVLETYSHAGGLGVQVDGDSEHPIIAKGSI